MHYSILTHAQLGDYIGSEAFLRSAVWPISPLRAASYGQNPDARPEHPVLFLAHDDKGTLRGFLGSLPDSWTTQGQRMTFAWLSCLWVDPACRGQGLAGALLHMSNEAWKGMLALTEYTPVAEALYRKSGLFSALPPRKGWRAYRRPDLEGTLLRRWPGLAPGTPLLRTLDRLGEGLISLSERQNPTRVDGTLQVGKTLFEAWKPGTSTSDRALLSSLENAVSPGQSVSLASKLKWIQQHPWLKQGIVDADAKRYPFSSVSAQFQSWLWLLSDEHGAYNGVVSMSLRDGLLKLPYCFAPENALPDVLALARQIMSQHSAHTLVTHHQGLVRTLEQNRKNFLHLRASSRHYMLSNELAEIWHEQGYDISQVQDGAGDAVFT